MDPGNRAGGSEVGEEATRLRARDRLDATRKVAPLRKAADAVEIDGTHLSFEEQTEAILAVVRAGVRWGGDSYRHRGT